METRTTAAIQGIHNYRSNTEWKQQSDESNAKSTIVSTKNSKITKGINRIALKERKYSYLHLFKC